MYHEHGMQPKRFTGETMIEIRTLKRLGMDNRAIARLISSWEGHPHISENTVRRVLKGAYDPVCPHCGR